MSASAVVAVSESRRGCDRDRRCRHRPSVLLQLQLHGGGEVRPVVVVGGRRSPEFRGELLERVRQGRESVRRWGGAESHRRLYEAGGALSGVSRVSIQGESSRVMGELSYSLGGRGELYLRGVSHMSVMNIVGVFIGRRASLDEQRSMSATAPCPWMLV